MEKFRSPLNKSLDDTGSGVVDERIAQYEDTDSVTLFRYENPAAPYKESREGAVSKSAIIGQWFTDNLDDLRTYIKMRQPGGRIVAIRVPKARLPEFDAGNLSETKDMDREEGNYIIPPELQGTSRLEIPLPVTSRVKNKFLFENFKEVNEFVNANLTNEAIVSRLKT